MESITYAIKYLYLYTQSPSNEQDEWGAYDVMIKLLSMWRSQIMLDDEISVEFLLPQTAMSRKAAAKAFGALLSIILRIL